MDLLAAIALLSLVVVAVTIVALEAVLGRTTSPRPAPALVPVSPAHLRGRAAHPAGHSRRS